MTNLPDDLLDPTEARLARRVRAFSDQATVPFDAVAIAAAAAAGGARRQGAGSVSGGSLGRRLGGFTGRLVVVGAAVALLAAGGAFFGFGGAKAPPASSAAVSTGSASTRPGDVATCASTDLEGGIVGWEGAAGSRIATVNLRNAGERPCRLADYELALVDAAGRGTALIIGPVLHPDVVLPAGDGVHTSIEVSNYCGAAAPQEPVSIRLDAAADGAADVVLRPAPDPLLGQESISGVPPCNGPAGSAGVISQQPWQPGIVGRL